MNYLFLFMLIVALILYYVFFRRKYLKNREAFKLNKKNFYKWMNLSKKERYDLSKRDSYAYSNTRKDLLTKIRNEYKIIASKTKSSKKK